MPRRVLVVDDNSIVRDVLEIVLNLDEDFELCGVARNATAAVMLAGELQPDIVILDYEMPGATGIDVLPTILHESPRSAVFLYSACDDLAAVNRARGAGAAGYFVKGVDEIAVMLDTLRAHEGPAVHNADGEASAVVAHMPPVRGEKRAAPAA